MNKQLFKHIDEADGRYLTEQELKPLESYLSTYQLRREIYALLQGQGDKLVIQTLRRMAQTHRQEIQTNGDKCKRDMGYVLNFAAGSLLQDDEAGFQERLVLWMQSIMRSLNKEAQSTYAYRELQKSISETLPPEHAALLNHYLDVFITALSLPA